MNYESIPEIKINKFQLSILLDRETKKEFDFLLNNGVYCSNCNGICPKVEPDYKM